jgi:hypothetical protein
LERNNWEWRTLLLEFDDSGLSMDILLSMVHESDFRNLDFSKKLINRAFIENNYEVIRNLLDKISAAFVFSSREFRAEIVEHVYSKLRLWHFTEVVDIGQETILGNVLILCYILRKIKVITPEKIGMLAAFSKLVHIEDPLTFEYVPVEGTLILDLNETLKSSKKSTIEKAIEACEILFVNGRLEKSKDTTKGMLVLYENSRRPEHRFKARIISALLNKRMDLFLALLAEICKGVHNEDQNMAKYAQVYDLLIRAGVPVFFDLNLFRFEFDRFYNANFYFARLLDNLGNEQLLMPFAEISYMEVQKVFDLQSEAFVSPTGRVGKIAIQDIYSFRKAREISEVTEQQTQITAKMSEDDVEKKIREILQDQNITSHSPAEKTDIYTHKLFVNNENDLRDVAIIIKGKGYPKVTLSDMASNLLKAVDLPVQIVFLVHTGTLFDEPREKFTTQCDRAKKMYCIVDVIDLTKLLLSYGKL